VPFVIAEIGSNWEGIVPKGKLLIKQCADAGADAVKFQMWRASDLYPGQNLEKFELTPRKAKALKEYADECKIMFLCSPFYPEAVDFLETLKVPVYKIASRTALMKDPHSEETLRAVAKTRKPVIISMGMGGNKAKIEKIFSKTDTTYCYCISEYPADPLDINWADALQYDGFSDHTPGISSAVFFGRKKVQCVIEKHVKLDCSESPDADSSINPQALADLITLTTSSSDMFA
jgi:N,N'-diacetyllegionaminate synthase